MKRHKRSVILGKFMPPHFGHAFAIQTAINFSDVTHLLVYTMESEPIEGYKRYAALREHFFNEIEEGKLVVSWIQKDLPQQPEDHPDFWKIWKDEINEAVMNEKIDCFFGSETYVETLGKVFGCDSQVVDIQREVVPTSGTSCRNNTIDEWEHIIPEFRHWMVKTICIVGGESTGKSSLAAALAKVYGTRYVEEYGREHCKVKPPTEFTTEDFEYIGTMQLSDVTASMRYSNRYLFCDTDAIITQAFHMLYLGKHSEFLDTLIESFNYDHYFLLAPTIDFVQDGTREFESRRTEQFDLIKSLLDKWKRPYTIIRENDFIKRIKEVKHHIENL